MGSLAAKAGYWLILAALLAALIAAVLFLVMVVLPEVRQGGYVPVTPSPSASGSVAPSGSPDQLMGGARVPAGASCAGCHLTDQGVIGLRAIPVMGHPLEGWSNCTACHTTDRLVATAPGHSGIHASECLTCHQAGNLPPPLSRPHRALQNTACLSCHGKTAPLPEDMKHRSESVCWLCHRLPDVPPPIPAHQTASGETDCLTCHVSGKVGALPPDHLKRTSAECLECHQVPMGTPAPNATPSLTSSWALPARVRWPA